MWPTATLKKQKETIFFELPWKEVH